jgi:hypothetical protein
MIDLVLGVGSFADIWNTGVKAYVQNLLTPDAGLAIVAAAVTAIRVRRAGGSVTQARTDAYTALVLVILVAFLIRVLAAAVIIPGGYVFIIAYFYGASVMFVFAGILTIDWARRNRDLFRRAPRGFLTESVLPVAALFAIAWTSSISFGYRTAAFFAVPMLAPILFDQLPLPTVVGRLWLITATAFVAFGLALAHPYGEASRIDKLVSVPPIVHGAALMRTSVKNAAKLRELAALIVQYPQRAITVLPAFTSFDVLFGVKSPSPVVWSVDLDLPPAKRSAYTTAILNRICGAHSLVVVEKDIAAVFQHRIPYLYSSVLAHVETAWHFTGETAHFMLYEAPDRC